MNPGTVRDLISEIDEFLKSGDLNGKPRGLLVRSLSVLEVMDDTISDLTDMLLGSVCNDHLDLCENEENLIVFNNQLQDIKAAECPLCLQALLDDILVFINEDQGTSIDERGYYGATSDAVDVICDLRERLNKYED